MKFITAIGLLLLTTIGHAQQLSCNASSIKQILIKPNGPDLYHLIYQQKEGSNKVEQLYEIIEFDTTLQPHSTTTFKLVGNYHLKDAIHFAGVSVTGLLNAAGDQLKFYVERDGAKVSELFIPLPARYKRSDIKLFPLPEENGFAVLYRTSPKSWGLKGMTLQGSILWSDSFTSTKRLGIPFAFERAQQLVMIQTENERSRKQQNRCVTYDLATGKKLQEQAISPGVKTSRSVDNAFMKDDIVFVAGRHFNQKRIRQGKTGQPYLLAIDSSLTSVEHKLHSSLATMKFFPMDVVPDANGKLFLVGETFTSESYFPYFMKAMATAVVTFGFVSVTWCNLKFNDAVIIPLEQQDAFPRIQNMPRRKVTVGSHLPGYQFARYAFTTGQVRYFGNQGGNIYLMNGGAMTKQSLITNQYVRLGGIPDHGRNILLRVTDKKVLAMDFKYTTSSRFSITALDYLTE